MMGAASWAGRRSARPAATLADQRGGPRTQGDGGGCWAGTSPLVNKVTALELHVPKASWAGRAFLFCHGACGCWNHSGRFSIGVGAPQPDPRRPEVAVTWTAASHQSTPCPTWPWAALKPWLRPGPSSLPPRMMHGRHGALKAHNGQPSRWAWGCGVPIQQRAWPLSIPPPHALRGGRMEWPTENWEF